MFKHNFRVHLFWGTSPDTRGESGKIFKVQRQLNPALDSIDCLGKFLQSEDRFGSCTLRQWWGPRHEFSREPMRWVDRPLKDLSCSACQRDCKIYALSFKADGQAQENQLILAVPGVCTNGDVAFRTVLANTASVNFEWRCFWDDWCCEKDVWNRHLRTWGSILQACQYMFTVVCLGAKAKSWASWGMAGIPGSPRSTDRCLKDSAPCGAPEVPTSTWNLWHQRN